jgi:hypothetical protein
MKKITITRGVSDVGSTLGAALHSFYIAFKEEGYAYTFHATEEGITKAAKCWNDGGYIIEWKSS